MGRSILVGAAVVSACGGPPFYMGAPLRKAVPADTAAPPPSASRAQAAAERAACRRASELSILARLSSSARATGADRARLADLLRARAATWAAAGRQAAAQADDRAAAALAAGPVPRAETSPCAWLQPGDDGWVLGAAAVFPRFSQLAPEARERLARGPFGAAVARLLVEEAPRSAESLLASAWLDARGGRPPSAEQKLADYVFYSGDRQSARRLVAQFWEEQGEGARACEAWGRAARADRDAAAWPRLLVCARRDRRFGDPTEIEAAAAAGQR